MKHIAILLALALALTSCKTLDTSTKKIEASCASATSSIQVAALYKSKLTAKQVEQITAAIDIVQPVCGNPDVIPTLDTAKQALFNAAVGQLFQIAMELKL